MAMEGFIIRGKGGWGDCILPFPINVQDYMMEWAACTRKLIIDPTAVLAKMPYVQGHSLQQYLQQHKIGNIVHQQGTGYNKLQCACTIEYHVTDNDMEKHLKYVIRCDEQG